MGPNASTYLSYAGPFEVPRDGETVIHQIEVCSFPTGSATHR